MCYACLTVYYNQYVNSQSTFVQSELELFFRIINWMVKQGRNSRRVSLSVKRQLGYQNELK